MNSTLDRLQRELKRHGITHDDVAAACTPTVHRTMVSKVVNGRAKSARVVATAKRLIAETDGQRTNGQKRATTGAQQTPAVV